MKTLIQLTFSCNSSLRAARKGPMFLKIPREPESGRLMNVLQTKLPGTVQAIHAHGGSLDCAWIPPSEGFLAAATCN